jgi:short-subunit dehydrogenase
VSNGKLGRALITGASSGIGEVFARKLASRGYDLIISARRKELLEKLAGELENENQVRVEVIVADLAREEGIQVLEKRLSAESDIEILVNNAGFGVIGFFADSDPAKNVSMINVHVMAATRLTRAALPGMIERNRGSIINISSVAGFFHSRSSVLYCSTKSYLTHFSKALHNELKDTGVKVQALCPGYTRTGFHHTEEYANFDVSRISRWLWMSAEEVVETSLKALGNGKVIVIPGIKYRFAVWLYNNMLTSWLVKMVSKKM